MEELITNAWRWFASLEEAYRYALSVVGGTGAIVWVASLGKWGVKPGDKEEEK